MKKQELKKLIKEELKKVLNESKIEFEEVVPNGTIIYIDGKKARVRANFRNSDGPSILFDYIEDNGLRGETGTLALNNPTIDQREVDLKITDEINEGKGKDLADKTIKKLREKFKKLTDEELDEFRKIIKDFL